MTPRLRNLYDSRSFRISIQSSFACPLGDLAARRGRTTHHTASGDLRDDVFGNSLKNASSTPGCRGRVYFHNNIQDALSATLTRARVNHAGGPHSQDRACSRIFRDAIYGGDNPPGDEDEGDSRRRAIRPDLAVYGANVARREPAGTGVDIGEFNTLIDVKTHGPTKEYFLAARDNVPGAGVQSRQLKVAPGYRNHARALDQEIHDTATGEVGPVEARLNEFQRGRVSGPVVGPYSEVSPDFAAILDTCATRIAADRGRYVCRDPKVLKQLALQSLRQEMLATIDKGWAAVIINGIENQDQGPDEPRRRRGQDRQWNCDEHHRRHRRR